MNEHPEIPTEYEKWVLQELIKWHRNPSFFSKLLNTLGIPVEKFVEKLPEEIKKMINSAVEEGFKRCLNLAKLTFDEKSINRELQIKAYPRRFEKIEDLPLEMLDKQAGKLHISNRLAVTISGFGTGMFGIWGAIFDIPASITMFFRNIQMVSICYGINPNQPQNIPYFLWLMTDGSPAREDDSSETGYIMARLGAGIMVTEAQKFLASTTARGLKSAISKEGAPVIVRLLNTVLSRLGVEMTEKVAAMAVPLAGAVTGAAINTAFIKDIHRNAIMAGRLQYLIRKYGNENIKKLMQDYTFEKNKNIIK